jgi:cupin superfamily acireductone dioxygenase involved in methionine salvage
MRNNKQPTAVDSIIELCQKQMDTEIHLKTTLLMMTNKTQQTAVDKAKELIDKMTKQYALIAVDEILSINSVDKDEDLSNYWEEVKQEIENYGK